MPVDRDYNTFTVANLRVLLRERGIPSTGLTRKAQIVAKLEEADAAEKTKIAQKVASQTQPTPAPPPEREESKVTVELVEDEKVAGKTQATQGPPPEPAESKVTIGPAEDEKVVIPKVDVVEKIEREKWQVVPGDVTTEPGKMSEELREAKAEEAEDTNGRKRRSEAPSVDEEEIARKRIKIDARSTSDTAQSKPEIELPVAKEASKEAEAVETTAFAQNLSPKPAEQNETKAAEDGVEAATQTKDQVSETNEPMEIDTINAFHEKDATISEHQQLPQEERQAAFSPDPAHGTFRQRSLFEDNIIPERRPAVPEIITKPDQLRSSPEESQSKDDYQNRDVEPSIHPATRAVYIRNFMRPLPHRKLIGHIKQLAGVHPQVFHVDDVRTHCFAIFPDMAPAERLRTAIHGVVWPEESTRKPLWADFVPEDSAHEWINVEKMESHKTAEGGSWAPGASRINMKRFEVEYIQKDGSDVETNFREVPRNGNLSVSNKDSSKSNTFNDPGTNAPRSAPLTSQGRFNDPFDTVSDTTLLDPLKQGNDLISPRTSDRGSRPDGAFGRLSRQDSRPTIPGLALIRESRSFSDAPPNAPTGPKDPGLPGARQPQGLQTTRRALPAVEFRPVAPHLARRRLAQIRRLGARDWQDGRGGENERGRPWSRWELAERRFTFENGDVLVDEGPADMEPRAARPRRERQGRRGRGRGGFRRGRRLPSYEK
ncbi:hypothetical protein BDY21DRAFT_422308 [Lineolata rhizophorae]|uniref:SAP domain-containing protein n=1 Tax=Lineolata rhizophorae TaxID=578093 RepID=A0A6A6NYD0_9PEZI|nr:hypothetical protein BDY21DRAFT_422308 [Lineolata rhizophorae]